MNIVFDMDNTLTDEMGSTVRPGIIMLLKNLKQDGHRLILWTNSGKARAKQILHDHRLNAFFSNLIFREDYDPDNRGVSKDIRKVNGDILIDDDPGEIRFVKSIKKKGFLIKPFRKNSIPDDKELDELYRFIQKSGGIMGRLFSD